MFIIKFSDPKGQVFYYPEGFGYTAHKLTKDIREAVSIPTESLAYKRLNGFLYPSYFWESERNHAKAMVKKFTGWTSEVVQKK